MPRKVCLLSEARDLLIVHKLVLMMHPNTLMNPVLPKKTHKGTDASSTRLKLEEGYGDSDFSLVGPYLFSI